MPEPAARTRILLVDDHTLFRESIARLLSREPDLDVVGHCGSIQEGLRTLSERPIDLVLLDYDLGQRKGNDFLRLAREAGVEAKMLIVTAGVDPGRAAELIRAGISGIFLKRDSAASLGIKGDETFDIDLPADIRPQQQMSLVVTRKDGSKQTIPVLCRIDTPIEVDYYKHGGILPFVLRELIAA